MRSRAPKSVINAHTVEERQVGMMTGAITHDEISKLVLELQAEGLKGEFMRVIKVLIGAARALVFGFSL